MADIYIYSPSGAVRDKAAFRRGLQRIKQLGHSVEVDPAALHSEQRFAGDDRERVAAISRAAVSGAQVALITRGGYGLTRILPDLDYAEIERAARGGMRWVGFSDFTAMQLAALAQRQVTTWSGPALLADFGAPEEPDDIMVACFEDLLYGHAEGTGWALGKKAAESLHERLQLLGLAKAGDELVPIARHATLWGGNLAVLSGMLGTPYFPQVEGGVLYLEDVAEPAYKIERMLTQLLHAGVLARQQAVVLGEFSDTPKSSHDRGFGLKSLVERLSSLLQVPVITGLPFGHVPTKVCLPTGACVDMVLQGRDVMITWGHDHPHNHDHAHGDASATCEECACGHAHHHHAHEHA